jgi:hypothetical protein
MNMRPRRVSPRAGLAGLALAACAATALGAENYSILSLVGDHFTVVHQGAQTGSHLDQDEYEKFPITGVALDDLAVAAAEAAIRRVRPDATVSLLRASRSIYPTDDGWLKADSAQARSLVAWVAKAAPPSPDSRLLVILPYRTEPQFLTYSGYRGTGSVAGLGFYFGFGTVDREIFPGFLGVFANLQMALVNLQTGAIEAHQPVIAGSAHSAAQSKGIWETLDRARKVAALTTLAQGEIERRIPAMVDAAR